MKKTSTCFLWYAFNWPNMKHFWKSWTFRSVQELFFAECMTRLEVTTFDQVYLDCFDNNGTLSMLYSNNNHTSNSNRLHLTKLPKLGWKEKKKQNDGRYVLAPNTFINGWLNKKSTFLFWFLNTLKSRHIKREPEWGSIVWISTSEKYNALPIYKSWHLQWLYK